MSTTERSRTSGERSVTTPESVGMVARTVSWPRRWWTRRFTNKAVYVRLHCELRAAQPEFELLARRSRSEDEPWVMYGRQLLWMAERNLERGAIDEAWRHLNTARRFEIYGLEKISDGASRARAETAAGEGADGEDRRRTELEIRAAAVREEALDTLRGWRRRMVVDLLCDASETLRDDVTASELRAASRVLHEHYESVYIGRSEGQRQFNQLILLGVLSGSTLLALSVADWMWEGSSGLTGVVADFLTTPFGATIADTASPGFALFVTVAGVMGASLFGMFSLRRRALSTNVSQPSDRFEGFETDGETKVLLPVVAATIVTCARGVIGAISALLLYFVLQTPSMYDGTILADGLVTPALMVVVGFAAGYSERMAPDVVSRVTSVTDSGADKPRSE